MSEDLKCMYARYLHIFLNDKLEQYERRMAFEDLRTIESILKTKNLSIVIKISTEPICAEYTEFDGMGLE